MKILEFRSDTFTKPTPAMRRAMAEAEVGDDQYGEDPTVNKLEKRAAESVGKEAGLYVASGMMGNLCGVLSQTQRGDEVILGDMAHIYQNEMDASFVLGGIVPLLSFFFEYFVPRWVHGRVDAVDAPPVQVPQKAGAA